MVQYFGFMDFSAPGILILLFLVVLAFEIVMFVHAVRNRNLKPGDKLLWLVGMLLIHLFVAVAYYFRHYRGRWPRLGTACGILAALMFICYS